MDWLQIVTIFLGSSVVATLISVIASRHRTRSEADKIAAEAGKVSAEADGTITEHYDGYAGRLENRIVRLEERVDFLERRDMIFESAVSCAYRCEYDGTCPVLTYLSEHPLPSKSDMINE